ncbi:TrfB-related DNA-binding protein [Massilia sp. DD77]|uniref:TrfB-related DNA-binding protein n=1 Tax=Massilia sp. DD77 TaxID=3109349 RepID=UPI002FFF7BFE
MRIKKRLTATDFELLRAHLRNFEKKNVHALRRILVDGIMQKELALELGMSKEAVSAMVGRAWRIYLQHGQRPEGWRTVEVTLPLEYADVIEELANILNARKHR